ncbi:MAG: hypothetical protein Q8N23_35685 [Archangium sp.]|nr:hypothetical protein [Archangium sp.]MDP3158068.1 hypothetical protein [Archangium sp.]MDP3570526.1 hypothetical protein [Archangium sp.]
MSPISKRSSAGSSAAADAAAAARRAAEKARADAARAAAAAAKAAAAANAALASSKKDVFAKGGLSAGAGAAAAAKLQPIVAGAKAELGKAGALIAEGSALIAPKSAGLAGLGGALAAEAKKLAETPSPIFTPFAFDVGALAEKARGFVDTVRDTVSTVQDTAARGLDLINQGAKKLTDLSGGLDTAKERAIDEVRKQVVDGPIDNLNSEGDSVKVNLGGELSIPTPIPDLKAKGVGDMSAEIKRDADGGYTISTEANALVGVSVGVEDPTGNSVSGDGLVGGGGKIDFKVKPVLNPDGTLNEVETKAKAKELTEALARQALVASAGPMGQPIANAVVGPTESQLALIKESFQGMEVKGSAAIALAAKLNLPGMITLDASGKVQQDMTIRIEKGEKGLVIAVKNTVSGEADVQGSGALDSVNVGVNGKAKVELEQRFEFPGINSVQDVINKGTSVKPEVKQSLTLSTDAQVGAGNGLGGESGIVDGKIKEQRRLGVTTEVKIDVTNDPSVIKKIASEALKGNLADATRLAGDNTNIELKTTIYTERSRLALGNIENKTVGGAGIKGEVLERDVIRAPAAVKTNASEVASQVKKQLEEVQRLQKEQRPPIMMRA